MQCFRDPPILNYKSEGTLFRSKRDFELNKATYDTEVNTAKAEAEMAYGLQEAKVRSKIKEEEMQVRIENAIPFLNIHEQNSGESGGASAEHLYPGAGDHEKGKGAGFEGEEAS